MSNLVSSKALIHHIPIAERKITATQVSLNTMHMAVAFAHGSVTLCRLSRMTDAEVSYRLARFTNDDARK